MTQPERTALSDNRMYQAAMELLCELGTYRTTLKEVGERAGYSRGLASARFGSKEGLFVSLVENIEAKWRAEVAREVDTRTGLAALLSVLDAVEHFLNEQPLYTKALYVLWYETVSSHNDVRRQLAAGHVIDRQGVMAMIRQGQAEGSIVADVSPERFAVQFMSFIFGTIYQWHTNTIAIDVAQTFHDYRETVVTLIGGTRRRARQTQLA
jgi:AcrR family transcriptional regulator